MDISRRNFSLGAASIGFAAALGASPLRAAVPIRPKMLDAIILGAGVSGLNAAWQLEQQGLKVMVLEARQRVGGRVLTLFDQPGYPEMGFNSMGDGYGRGIDAATRAGVELVDVGPRYRKGPPQALFLNGEPVTREDWARLPSNPFPDALKTAMPWEIVNKLIREHNPLTDWAEWTDPKNAALDISLHDFLSAQGLSDPAIKFAFDTSPYYGTSAHDISALMLEFNDGWVKSQAASGPRSLAVKGGNLKLPMAMAKLIKGDLLLGKEVVAIASEADAATVTCADGTTFRAARIVCSLPFATLRSVKILPGLNGPQAKAVATLAYQPLSIAFLTATAPFWDEDHVSPAMWTDTALGTVLPQRFGATEDEISGLMVQARGELARYWDRLGRDAALQRIVATFEQLRPAAKGKLRGAALHSWAAEPFNGGDWAYFGPGQVAGFVGQMAHPAGRIHFCGEHTATGNRGLEGALESSERVALEVLSA